MLVIEPLGLTPMWFNSYASELQAFGFDCNVQR